MTKRLAIFIVVAALTLGVAVSAFASGKQVTVTYGSGKTKVPWDPPYFPDGCRCQMFYDQAKISYAGTINEFELEKSNASSCTVTNVKFYLCHTKLAELTTNFNDNYGGNTPVLVASYAEYTLPARAGFYPIPMTKTFAYNNKENLILELTYEKASGALCGSIYGVSPLHHRCWAKGPTPLTGRAEGLAHNGRISFSYYTAVSPTSLGRVKALYE